MLHQEYGKKIFVATKTIPYLDIIMGIEGGISKLSAEEHNDIHCRVNMSLKNPYFVKPNITYDERRALQEMKVNKELILHQADKGGSVVLNTSDYEMMENVLMEDLVKDEYEVLETDSITHIKRKVHSTRIF